MDEYDHRSVAHGRRQYLDRAVHTDGIESFWAPIERAHKETYHRMSRKPLSRYVREFAGSPQPRHKGPHAAGRAGLRGEEPALEGVDEVS